MRRWNDGFSLIELMIALAISAILAVIAYPVYTTYQARAYRQKAEVILLHGAAYLAAYFEQYGTYAGAELRDIIQGADGHASSYRFAIVKRSDAHFLLNAIPDAVQQKRDIGCGILSLTDDNVRGDTGNQSVRNCW